ncbi:MAG: hypothetical protein L0L18_08365 [Acidipropionibacterium jensenii]|nr:hypothetical protein [Acidipropionibacterium jensenii]
MGARPGALHQGLLLRPCRASQAIGPVRSDLAGRVNTVPMSEFVVFDDMWRNGR